MAASAATGALLVGLLAGCSTTPSSQGNCDTLSGVVDAIQPIVDEQLDEGTFRAYDASLKRVLKVARPAISDPTLTPLLDELEKVDASTVDPAQARAQYRQIVGKMVEHCPSVAPIVSQH